MSAYKTRLVLKIKNLRLFSNLEVGLTRGDVRDSERLLEQAQRRIQKLRSRLAEKNRQLAQQRRQLRAIADAETASRGTSAPELEEAASTAKEFERTRPKERKVRTAVADNPFQDLSPDQIYALLTDPNNDLPLWQSEQVQQVFTMMSGPGAVRRTQSFIDMLDADGAFTPGWKGLDYGAGWGRIASLLLAKGTPEQLDLVDAWEKGLNLLERGRFKNRRWKVSEILKPGEIPENTYDFVYAFSVFTHLSEKAFWTNLDVLTKSIRSPGTVYFTVRHREFIDHYREHIEHLSPDRVDEVYAALESEGFWFTPLQSDPGVEGVFGTTVVTEERLRDALGPVEYLGRPKNQMQHVYALRV